MLCYREQGWVSRSQIVSQNLRSICDKHTIKLRLEKRVTGKDRKALVIHTHAQRTRRFTMIFLLYECLMVVVECWPFTREISDNRRRKCLQTPDYYRKCSYDAHTRIVYTPVFTRFRVTESASTRNFRTYEKTCDIVTFTIIIN